MGFVLAYVILRQDYVTWKLSCAVTGLTGSSVWGQLKQSTGDSIMSSSSELGLSGQALQRRSLGG